MAFTTNADDGTGIKLRWDSGSESRISDSGRILSFWGEAESQLEINMLISRHVICIYQNAAVNIFKEHRKSKNIRTTVCVCPSFEYVGKKRKEFQIWSWLRAQGQRRSLSVQNGAWKKSNTAKLTMFLLMTSVKKSCFKEGGSVSVADTRRHWWLPQMLREFLEARLLSRRPARPLAERPGCRPRTRPGPRPTSPDDHLTSFQTLRCRPGAPPSWLFGVFRWLRVVHCQCLWKKADLWENIKHNYLLNRTDKFEEGRNSWPHFCFSNVLKWLFLRKHV